MSKVEEEEEEKDRTSVALARVMASSSVLKVKMVMTGLWKVRLHVFI